RAVGHRRPGGAGRRRCATRGGRRAGRPHARARPGVAHRGAGRRARGRAARGGCAARARCGRRRRPRARRAVRRPRLGRAARRAAQRVRTRAPRPGVIASVLQLALTVLFGALAGGITNTIAIWMLFHPYQPPRLWGRRLRSFQGAIPKNKARLAAAVGRTVGTRLLTGEDLARTVAEPGFREAFDERLRDFLEAILSRERGPLAEELAPGVAAELRHLLHDAAVNLLARLDAYLESDEFHAAALRWADALTAELGDQPISDVLTPEREAALAERADTWLAQVLGGEGFERTVREYLDRSAERLLDPSRTFQDVVPVGLVAAVERAISAYLPIALERLGSLLEAPGARARVERVLHEILDRFMKDLKF